MRTALGASRRRIIGQLFAEALVLGGVAAIVGLFGAHFALQWWLGVSAPEAGGRLPFWFTDRLSPVTVLYAMLLSVLSAVIAGVVPAMKVTAAASKHGFVRQALVAACGSAESGR